jgi:hypothetical protein
VIGADQDVPAVGTSFTKVIAQKPEGSSIAIHQYTSTGMK